MPYILKSKDAEDDLEDHQQAPGSRADLSSVRRVRAQDLGQPRRRGQHGGTGGGGGVARQT